MALCPAGARGQPEAEAARDGLRGSQKAPDFTPDALAPSWPDATQLYPPIPPLLGQKGRKALHTHCCSILCQRSGIWRAAGGEEREAGQRRGAARLLGLLPAWGAPARQRDAVPRLRPRGRASGGREGCRRTLAWFFLLRGWLKGLGRGTSGSHPSPRATAGLVSVSHVLCLVMLCQCIFRVGGRSPLLSPVPSGLGGACRRAGACPHRSPRTGIGLGFAWAACSPSRRSCAGGEGRR